MDQRRNRIQILRLVAAPLVLSVTLLVGLAPAQESVRKLVIGTKQAAPFSYRIGDGPWQGISIELWRRIAEDLGIAYEFKEVPLAELISGLQNGSLDASVAALTVTAEREAKIDFSHPFYPSGLAIAVPAAEIDGIWATIKAILSWRFLQGIGALVLLLLMVGFLIWIFERRKNPEQFGGDKGKGIGSGFWWSAVTMTTVGYGDKSPITLGGRVIALIWMFVAIVTISGFTASIASSLTVARLESAIRGPEDLRELRTVLTVRDSTSERYLERSKIHSEGRATIEEALKELAKGVADAVVYDAPILRYLASKKHSGRIDVLPVIFDRQDYAIGLPPDSKYRKAINTALLELISQPEWDQILFRHLGE